LATRTASADRWLDVATLTVQEAAERASVSDRSVRRWIADGVLPATRGRHGWTVADEDLAAFLAAVRPTDDRDGQPAEARTSAVSADGQRTSETSALAALLREAIERAERNASAAAMWQARAELLHAQVEQLRALPPPPPDVPQDAPERDSTQQSWWRRLLQFSRQ
jgi:excisionase family DNA binding protein